MKTFVGVAVFVVLFSSAIVASPEADIIYGNEEAEIAVLMMAPKMVVTSHSRPQAAGKVAADSTKKGRCERRAFEVNDFGKEGPISLAKKDLANYVAMIKKRERVKSVRVSQKTPVCRLYLWLGPASEYTCRIEASICW